MRSLFAGVGLLLGLALGQGLEVGVFGPGPTLYARLHGALALEGAEVRFALAPYAGLRASGVAVEDLRLGVGEGSYALELGRFPLTPGEGRLFPYTWNRPGPALAPKGVWGGHLTWYGEALRLRAGYAWERGAFLEVALPEGRVFLSREAVGAGGAFRLGGWVVYGDAFWTPGGGLGTLGATGFWDGVLWTVELAYPGKAGVEARLLGEGWELGLALVRDGDLGARLVAGLEGARGWIFLWEAGVAWGVGVGWSL